jgi:hypothetical protein
VAQDDVADFVGHDAGYFAFRLGRLDHAAIDEHRSAGQRKGVDIANIDGFEAVFELGLLQLRWDGVDQPAAQFFHI